MFSRRNSTGVADESNSGDIDAHEITRFELDDLPPVTANRRDEPPGFARAYL